MGAVAIRRDSVGAGELPSPELSAQEAGLVYVDDRTPGVRRRGTNPKHFVYFNSRNQPIRDDATLRRIRSLAIPPAWTDVWICSDPRGHLQATGRDARGRKQYRYHPRFREVREQSKYDRIFAFAEALPRIRARCKQDLAQPKLTRDKVLALVVSLLGQTFIRIGNSEYTRTNQSFGLTTLQDRHVRVRGAKVEFRFRGKAGKDRHIKLTDARLAKLVKRCQDLPGEHLFQYVDAGGKVRCIGSADVNEYLRKVAGAEFTAKDFRTWAGTLYAAVNLAELGRAEKLAEAKRRVKEAIEGTSRVLGNTPSICRKCYIHPAVLEGYLRGHTLPQLRSTNGSHGTGLKVEERALVSFLRKALKALESEQDLEAMLKKSLAKAKGARASSKTQRARAQRRAANVVKRTVRAIAAT